MEPVYKNVRYDIRKSGIVYQTL